MFPNANPNNNNQQQQQQQPSIQQQQLQAPLLAMPDSVEMLHGYLVEFLDCHEKSRRLSVENTISACLENQTTRFLFVALLRMEPNSPGLRPGVRQLGAVLLHKKILAFFRGLDDLERQTEFQDILLGLLSNEPRRPERNAIGALVSAIARTTLELDIDDFIADKTRRGWPQLLSSLHEAYKSGNPDFAELALKLVTTNAEPLMNSLRQIKRVKDILADNNNNNDTNNNNNSMSPQEKKKERKRKVMMKLLSQEDVAYLQKYEEMIIPLVRDFIAFSLRSSGGGGGGQSSNNNNNNVNDYKLQLAALEALKSILPHIHGAGDLKRDIIAELLPAALDAVVATASQNTPEGLEAALKTMDVLCDILDLGGSAQSEFVENTIDFLCTTAASKQLHPRLREQAVELLCDFIASRANLVAGKEGKKKKKKNKNNNNNNNNNQSGGFGSGGVLLNRFFTLALELMAEDERLCLGELAEDEDGTKFEKNSESNNNNNNNNNEYSGGGDGDGGAEDMHLNRLMPPCFIGGRMIKVLSMNIRPSKLVGQLVINAASTASVSGDPFKLKSAMVALGCAAEGCSSLLRKQLPAIMIMSERMFAEGNNYPSFVKEAAAFSLGLFCRYLRPEITDMIDRVMPLLLNQLDGNNNNSSTATTASSTTTATKVDEHVRVSTSRSLEVLCETLDADKLRPYASVLLERVVAVLLSETVSPSTQYNLCGVITAAVDAASEAFINRGEDLIRLLLTPLKLPLQSHNSMMLRAKVLEAVGALGLAIGPQRFGSFFEETWQIASDSIKFSPQGEDVSELHEACFGFFSNMAKTGKDEFFGSSYVSFVVPLAVHAVEDESYMHVTKTDPLGARRNAEQTNSMLSSSSSSSSSGNEEGGGTRFVGMETKGTMMVGPGGSSVVGEGGGGGGPEDQGAGGAKDRFTARMPNIDMKCSAIHCLGTLAEHCPEFFSPFVSDCCDVLLLNTSHFHSAIKQQSIESLANVVVSLRHEPSSSSSSSSSSNSSSEKTGGESFEIFKKRAPEYDSLPPKLRAAVEKYITEAILEVWTEEDDREVCASACQGLITVIEHLGSLAVHNYIEEIVQHGVVNLLQRNAPCFEDDEEDDDDDDDVDEDDFEDDDDAFDENNNNNNQGGGGNNNNNNNNSNNNNSSYVNPEFKAYVDSEDAEIDRALLDSIGELIEALVNAYGSDFIRFFPEIAKSLEVYCGDDRSGEDHVMAMGSLAELVMKIGNSNNQLDQYFPKCLQIALGVVDYTDEIVAKLNACFMFSALATHCGQCFSPEQVQSVLHALWLLLDTLSILKKDFYSSSSSSSSSSPSSPSSTTSASGNNNNNNNNNAEISQSGPEDVMRCEDNAVSAVCSLIKSGCIPFDGPMEETVLPKLFSMLPLQADFREAENVYSCLAHLASHHLDRLSQSADVGLPFLKCCAKCLLVSDSHVEPIHKSGLSNCLIGTVFNKNLNSSATFIQAVTENNGSAVGAPRLVAALKQLIR